MSVAGRWTGIVVVAATVLAAAAADAQRMTDRWHVSATVASDYFERGLSQAAGGPAWRLAADYAHPDGFFAGAFAANVEYGDSYGRAYARDRQLGFYGGYQSRGPRWSARASLARYRYPGGASSYDYSIVSAGAAYRNRYFFNVSYSPDWLGLGRAGNGFDVGLVQPLGWDLELGVNLGRLAIEDYRDSRFTYWDVGLSRAFGRFAVDLRYHASTAERATWLGDPGQTQIALSIAYAIAPRGP